MKLKKYVLTKIRDKKGGEEGEFTIKIIGIVFVLLMIACVSIPMINNINKSGKIVNGNYTKTFNGIVKAAQNGTDVSVSLDLLEEETE